MIVGIKENTVLDFNLVIESNHIRLELKKGTLNKIEDFIKDFNQIEWTTKFEDIINLTEIEEDEIRQKIKEYALEKTDLKQFTFDDFQFEDEHYNNVRLYTGKSIDIIDNIRFFPNNILPIEVIEMIKTFNDNIEYLDVENNPIESFVSGLNDYVIYMGPNEKYRGCIGKVVNERDNVASLLVEFPNKFRESGRIARFWSKPANLVTFKED